ncbi:unnamed protein product [Closterium sp. Naga37s-1]|nr:unnamed protein product [Closterium sp. Naga37s-1]
MAGAAARRQRNLVMAAALGVFTLGTLSLPLLLRYCLPPHPRLSFPCSCHASPTHPPPHFLPPCPACVQSHPIHFLTTAPFRILSRGLPAYSQLAESHVPIPLLSPLSSAFRLPHVLDFLPFPPPYSPLSLSCLLGSSSAFTRAAAGEGGGHLNPQAGYRDRFHSQPLVEREGALSPQAVQRGPYLNAGSKDIGRDPTPIHVYKQKRESQADQ